MSAPHVMRISSWPVMTAMVFIAYRLIAAWRRWPLPGPWLRFLLVVLVCAGIVFDFSTRFGRDASVAMLLLMAALKALELRHPRDGLVIINLGYFLIITSFLYSQSAALASYMLVLMLCITALLTALQRRDNPFSPGQSLRLATRLMLQGVPLMLVLFLLFPRVEGPLFGWPQSSLSGMSGLSDEMSPGSLSALSLSDDVAFRVQFESATPEPSTLYWRGPVLWDFGGRTWRVARVPVLQQPIHHSVSRRVRYQVTLEPQQARWLFAIDLTSRIPAGAVLTADYQLLSRQALRQRQSYDMESDLGYGAPRNPSRPSAGRCACHRMAICDPASLPPPFYRSPNRPRNWWKKRSVCSARSASSIHSRRHYWEPSRWMNSSSARAVASASTLPRVSFS
ncbi:MAG: DUF3488 domain-containing protein [Betaproteobacteria bacterium]|nr:DUF3488 domain-containing protein [Betaproteobacteria bacterium]